MNTIVRTSGYSFQKALAEAQTRLDYYEEGVLLDVAHELSKAMRRKKVTVSALAHLLDGTPASITRILRGHKSVSLKTITKIAFALGMKWEFTLVPIKKK
jgi:hypothetical protein